MSLCLARVTQQPLTGRRDLASHIPSKSKITHTQAHYLTEHGQSNDQFHCIQVLTANVQLLLPQ